MPYKDTAESAGLQVFISDEAVNTALTTLLEYHPVDLWLNATEHAQLNTGTLDKAFPGISAYYGPNQPVNVNVDVTNLYNFAVTEGDETVALNGDARIKFYVDKTDGTTDLAADISLSKLIMEATILIDGYNITGNFTKLKVQNLVVNECAFGTISVFKLKMEINVGLAVAAEPINKKLSALVVPETVLGYFKLSDLVIGYHDGYLSGGATPTFLPPAMTLEDLLMTTVHEVFKSDADLDFYQ